MLTSFEQVREWINDNGFKRWVLFKDRTRQEKILDSANYPSDHEDKLAMTEKYLRWSGGSAYAAGAPSNAVQDLTTTCEIRLADTVATPAVGAAPAEPYDIGKIEERIRKQIKAELREEDLNKREKDLADRERAFRAEQQTGMAAFMHLMKPVGEALIQRGMLKNVAGTDTDAPYHAQPIEPTAEPEPQPNPQEPAQPQEPSAWDNFTEQEGEEIGELMARFKKAEPEYWLTMFRNVVEMAEKKDTTYNMARSFLIQ